METRPGILSRIADRVLGKSPLAASEPIAPGIPAIPKGKESFAEMAGRLQAGGKNPQRWANLGGRWVLWTDKYSIQRYITDIEKRAVKANDQV